MLLANFSCVLAMKLEKVPLMADFHLGYVTGPGAGLNFGAKALLPLPGALKIGVEIEQLITDINNSSNINALRLGGSVGLRVRPDLTINYHLGSLGFTSNQDIVYQDSSGQTQRLTADTNYKGSYWGVSLAYYIWGFYFSPKYIVNTVTDKGTIAEFDFNVGKEF